MNEYYPFYRDWANLLIGFLLGILVCLLVGCTPQIRIIEQNNTVVTERIVIANVTSMIKETCAPAICECTCTEDTLNKKSGYSIHGGYATNDTWWKNMTYSPGYVNTTQ